MSQPARAGSESPMEKRWLDRFAEAMGRLVPDAITASVLLLILVVAGTLGLGNSLAKTMEAYYQGLWMLLPFTMQMTLIIVLSSALGSTPFFRRAILTLSRAPQTAHQVVMLAALTNALAAYLYWGLSISLGPVIAVYFATAAERKGIPVDFPFLLSVVWAAGAIWQYGLSASAPLLVATPGHFLEKFIGVLPLSTTIWSAAAIAHEFAFTTAVMAVGCLLMPKRCRPVSSFPESRRLLEPVSEDTAGPLTHAERLERSSLGATVLCVALAGWLYFHFAVKRMSLDINSLNTILLLLSLLFHRNVRSFAQALQRAVLSGWAVIVIYHLYAGIAGLLQFTTTGETLAGTVASVATPLTFPLLTAAISALFAVFIPSSGGQWTIQGLVTARSAMAVGVSVQRGILSLSVGDHVGNFVSPFWAVIVAGIARLDFRTFFGYGLMFAVIWFVIGVLIFTFAPG